MDRCRLVETDRVKLKPEVAKTRIDPAFLNVHGEIVNIPTRYVTINWSKFNKSPIRNIFKETSKFSGSTTVELNLGNKWTRVKWDNYTQEFMELVEDLDKL